MSLFMVYNLVTRPAPHRKNRTSHHHHMDPFLSEPRQKRTQRREVAPNRPKRSKPAAPREPRGDDNILLDSDSETGSVSQEEEEAALESDEEFAGELSTDKRRRLAQQYLDNLQTHEFDGEDFDAADLDNDLIAKRLQTDVAEQKGYVYQFIADKIGAQLDEVKASVTRVGCKSPTGVSITGPNVCTVSKDGNLVKYSIKPLGKLQRAKHTLVAAAAAIHELLSPRTELTCVATLAKYVVTGTKDGHLIIWLSELLVPLKVLNTRGAVLSIAFRRGSDQLYAACGDLKIRTFSIAQFQQLEVLYGHQDEIVGLSTLARETCVSVGARDKTAMFWKIADELRLTFRGGDSVKRVLPINDYFEGSLDTVLMVDESHFVTGADNGNVLLWLLQKKKPMFTERLAHGVEPALEALEATAECDPQVDASDAVVDVPKPQPYWITAIHAVPFSDVFITGSYLGAVKFWKIDNEGLRKFTLLGEIAVRGCVVEISTKEADGKLDVVVLSLKEHRLGRWLKVEGRNLVVSMKFDI